jgi:hypothetical protein
MTDPLTPDRFAELADAYGGVVARWPEEVRAEAMEMARLPEMQAILASASQLDARLDLWRGTAPSQALHGRVLAARRISVSRRARLWLSGLGIATALAGATAGSVAVAAALPTDHTVSDDATAFGDLAQQED